MILLSEKPGISPAFCYLEYLPVLVSLLLSLVVLDSSGAIESVVESGSISSRVGAVVSRGSVEGRMEGIVAEGIVGISVPVRLHALIDNARVNIRIAVIIFFILNLLSM